MDSGAFLWFLSNQSLIDWYRTMLSLPLLRFRKASHAHYNLLSDIWVIRTATVIRLSLFYKVSLHRSWKWTIVRCLDLSIHNPKNYPICHLTHALLLFNTVISSGVQIAAEIQIWVHYMKVRFGNVKVLSSTFMASRGNISVCSIYSTD